MMRAPELPRATIEPQPRARTKSAIEARRWQHTQTKDKAIDSATPFFIDYVGPDSRVSLRPRREAYGGRSSAGLLIVG